MKNLEEQTTKIFVIIDKTNNTNKDYLGEGNQLVENLEDALQFDSREEAQKYFDENGLDNVSEFQAKWAAIVEREK